ncbi:MAG: hypothetical protein P8090_05855 [Gammaproteobacteria bacterium]
MKAMLPNKTATEAAVEIIFAAFRMGFLLIRVIGIVVRWREEPTHIGISD